jgi:hypothetical protein
VLSLLQTKDIVMHVDGVTALRQHLHHVIVSNEEPAFEVRLFCCMLCLREMGNGEVYIWTC